MGTRSAQIQVMQVLKSEALAQYILITLAQNDDCGAYDRAGYHNLPQRQKQVNKLINRMALVCKTWWHTATSADAVLPRTVIVNDENESAWSPWWGRAKVVSSAAGSITGLSCCSEVTSLTLLPAPPQDGGKCNVKRVLHLLERCLNWCGPHLLELVYDIHAQCIDRVEHSIDGAPYLELIHNTCPSLKALHLNTIKIDRDICALADMSLEELHLNHVEGLDGSYDVDAGTYIYDIAAASNSVREALCKHWQLSRLYIETCEDFSGLDVVLGPVLKSSGSRLTHLELTSGWFGDEVLIEAAQHCHNLQYLNLNDSNAAVTEAGIIAVVSVSKWLRHIDLSGHAKTTDTAVTCIATNCRLLETLGLYGCCEVTEAGFKTLGEHSAKLSAINLGSHTITCDALETLAQCPMQSLNLWACKGLTPDVLGVLAHRYPALTELNLWGMHMSWENTATEADLIGIAVGCPKLQSVNLSRFHANAATKTCLEAFITRCWELLNYLLLLLFSILFITILIISLPGARSFCRCASRHLCSQNMSQGNSRRLTTLVRDLIQVS